MPPVLSQDQFTSNEDIDQIQIGDSTIDIVGYVDKIETNSYSSGAQFYKIIVNNCNNKRVQVTAWRNNMKLIDKIQRVHTIVHVSTAMAIKPKREMYNGGNVPFELLVQENTVVTPYGNFEEDHTAEFIVPEEITMAEAARKRNEYVTITGFLKTSFRKHKQKNFEFFIGSITDCTHKLEVKCRNDLSEVEDIVCKGMQITVTGMIELFPPGPPMLCIEGPKNIVVIPDGEKVTLAELLNGFTTPE